jgi:hypothetical protein
MSQMGQSRPRFPALALPDVRYASISNQSFAAPRLVATGHKPTFATLIPDWTLQRVGMYFDPFIRSG